MIVFGLSDIGRKRTNNEDRFCALAAPNVASGVDGVLSVADGLGGHVGGELASQLAIDTVREYFSSSLLGQGHGESGTDASKILKEVFSVSNTRILHTAKEHSEFAGMATTLTVAIVAGNNLCIAHAGDSRAYLIEPDAISRLTRDHTWVNDQVDIGLLTVEAARAHPNRDVLTRALGVSSSIQPDLSQHLLPSGASVLLCSDGLYEMLTEEHIAALVRSARNAEEACQACVVQANKEGGLDNITVVLGRR